MANSSQSTFLLSAADVTWAREELSCVDVTVAAAALDGKYFLIDAPASHGGTNQEFYVWFDLDASSADPAPGLQRRAQDAQQHRKHHPISR